MLRVTETEFCGYQNIRMLNEPLGIPPQMTTVD